jgi:hypothetical protein
MLNARLNWGSFLLTSNAYRKYNSLFAGNIEIKAHLLTQEKFINEHR